MRHSIRWSLSLATALVTLSSSPTFAQAEDEGASSAPTDIIVSARRRDESVQDVPLSVIAVTAETLSKLNVRDFRDVQNLVPGLELQPSPNGIQPTASIRGLNNDTTAAGNNGTIQFYLNDAPLALSTLLTAMFDVGQIEVQRGPQGTLRGRASPSGSIAVTTRTPDLQEFGAYFNGTGQTHGAFNMNGAIGVPVIKDVLAVRVAGLFDRNRGSRIVSVNSNVKPFSETSGQRISVRFDPFDSLSLKGSFTNIKRKGRDFQQVESASLANPALPASPLLIEADDRLAAGVLPQPLKSHFKLWHWQADWHIAGQRLVYVGSHTDETFNSFAPGDIANAYAGLPDAVRLSGQQTDSHFRADTHELRLQSDERLFGMLDYVVGGMIYKVNPQTTLVRPTLVFRGPPSAATFLTTVNTTIIRDSRTRERSLFGNLTLHLGEKTELSGGARYINYQVDDRTIIPSLNSNLRLQAEESNWIYSGSLKHRFNDSFMAYATVGTSWRNGTTTNGLINTNAAPSPVEARLQGLQPSEKSTSYEIGFKSDFLDRRLRLNVSAFHQDFKNYIVSVTNIYVAYTDPATGAQGPRLLSSLGTGVPAKVDGVEAELSFQASDRWTIDASVAYAKSKIKNGLLPCNNFPTPPASNAVITGANGGETIGTCTVGYSASRTSPLSFTLQSEYHVPVSPGADAFVRGFMRFNGKSANDPANAIDNVSAYALANLYTGVRDPDGMWEISLFAKNLFDVNRVINRNPLVASAPVQIGRTGSQVNSTYRAIQTLAPREFGVNVRIAFGSR